MKVSFDSGDPEFVADPYQTYARLRAAGRVLPGGPGQWIFTRYDDVQRLLRDGRLGSEFPAAAHRVKLGDGPAGDFFGRILIDRDPPDHTRLRQGMRHAFSPGSVAGLRAQVAATVDELLAPLLDDSGFDLVAGLATPLPVLVICSLLGVPAEDVELVRPRMVDLATAFGELTLTDEQRRATDRAVVWLREYVGARLGQGTAGDLLSRMLAAEADGFSRQDTVDNAIFLFFAGFETTTSLIANGTVALLTRPDQFERLRRDPSLIPTAVEELLRFDSPVQMSMRLVREPFVADGTKIRPGRVAVLLLGSANRDEQVFPDPDQLDVGRHPNPHVAFGGGHHYCLGAPLARLEASLVLDRLIHRFSRIELTGPPIRRPHPSIRSFRSVPLTAKPA